MQQELIENALNSGKNLVILHNPGTGLYANISVFLHKNVEQPSALFISPVHDIDNLLSVLNQQETVYHSTLVIELNHCDFMLAGILKSIFRDGTFRYITPCRDLTYSVKNRVIITTHNQDIFDMLKVGAEECGGMAISWVCTPEEKIIRLKEIYLQSIATGISASKAEEIFTFCISKLGDKLNLRHLHKIIEYYKSSGFYKSFGSMYLEKYISQTQEIFHI